MRNGLELKRVLISYWLWLSGSGVAQLAIGICRTLAAIVFELRGYLKELQTECYLASADGNLDCLQRHHLMASSAAATMFPAVAGAAALEVDGSSTWIAGVFTVERGPTGFQPV